MTKQSTRPPIAWSIVRTPLPKESLITATCNGLTSLRIRRVISDAAEVDDSPLGYVAPDGKHTVQVSFCPTQTSRKGARRIVKRALHDNRVATSMLSLVLIFFGLKGANASNTKNEHATAQSRA